MTFVSNHSIIEKQALQQGFYLPGVRAPTDHCKSMSAALNFFSSSPFDIFKTYGEISPSAGIKVGCNQIKFGYHEEQIDKRPNKRKKNG